MDYNISINDKFNSLEVAFSEKPSEAVREALKALKFRWHNVKKVWYGFADKETLEKAINGTQTTTKASVKASAKTSAKANKYGVKVGDIFECSWGYDQTNVDFFQVIALVGKESVRVREVNPVMLSEDATSGMSADRTYKLTNDVLPPSNYSVFIDDQEKGDLKRVKSYSADGLSNPCILIGRGGYMAHKCAGETVTTYESWYR